VRATVQQQTRADLGSGVEEKVGGGEEGRRGLHADHNVLVDARLVFTMEWTRHTQRGSTRE